MSSNTRKYLIKIFTVIVVLLFVCTLFQFKAEITPTLPPNTLSPALFNYLPLNLSKTIIHEETPQHTTFYFGTNNRTTPGVSYAIYINYLSNNEPRFSTSISFTQPNISKGELIAVNIISTDLEKSSHKLYRAYFNGRNLSTQTDDFSKEYVIILNKINGYTKSQITSAYNDTLEIAISAANSSHTQNLIVFIIADIISLAILIFLIRQHPKYKSDLSPNSFYSVRSYCHHCGHCNIITYYKGEPPSGAIIKCAKCGITYTHKHRR